MRTFLEPVVVRELRARIKDAEEKGTRVVRVELTRSEYQSVMGSPQLEHPYATKYSDGPAKLLGVLVKVVE